MRRNIRWGWRILLCASLVGMSPAIQFGCDRESRVPLFEPGTPEFDDHELPEQEDECDSDLDCVVTCVGLCLQTYQSVYITCNPWGGGNRPQNAGCGCLRGRCRWFALGPADNR